MIDQSLINEIAVAFPLDPIPLADDITRCTYDKKNGGSFSGPCSDCVVIAEFFAAKQWDEPTPLAIRCSTGRRKRDHKLALLPEDLECFV